MFDLVERTLRLSRDVGQADLHQHGAGDMVSLDTRLAALATLKTLELLDLAVKLLDLPARATRILCRRRRVLSEVVGHDPVRAVARFRPFRDFCCSGGYRWTLYQMTMQ